MYSIRIIRAGREGYYLKPEEENLPYLTGTGADLLRLGSESIAPTDIRLKLLFQGINPQTFYPLRRQTSARLARDPKTGKEKLYKPVVGYDLVANAPKDVSILALALGCDRAIELHEFAVEQTLSCLNRYCTAPTTKGTVPLEPIVLVQVHTMSRAQEPHLHSHCFIMNTGLITPNQGRALDGNRLLKCPLPLGKTYRETLRSLIESELGLSTFTIPLRKGESFGIKGIPDRLRAAFSSRSSEMKEYVKNSKRKPTSTTMRLAALKTRLPKQEVDRAELTQAWQEQAQGLSLELLRHRELEITR